MEKAFKAIEREFGDLECRIAAAERLFEFSVLQKTGRLSVFLKEKNNLVAGGVIRSSQKSRIIYLAVDGMMYVNESDIQHLCSSIIRFMDDAEGSLPRSAHLLEGIGLLDREEYKEFREQFPEYQYSDARVKILQDLKTLPRGHEAIIEISGIAALSGFQYNDGKQLFGDDAYNTISNPSFRQDLKRALQYSR